MFAVDQSGIGLSEDGFFLFLGGNIGEDAPSLRDKVDLTLGIVAGAHGFAIVEVGTEEPSTVPGILLEGFDQTGTEVGEFCDVGEVGSLHQLRELFHLGQEVAEEEGNPHTLTLAANTHTRHAVIPVAATHEG